MSYLLDFKVSKILPGNHLCSVDALHLSDDANSFLWVVQVVQQHADHIVPVLRAFVGSCRILVSVHTVLRMSGSLSAIHTSQPQVHKLTTYLPSASLAFAYCK